MCVSGKPVEPRCCCSRARSGGSRLTHYFCPNISSFLPKRYSNLEKRGHLSAERSAGTFCSVNTRGYPAACDGGQTSGLCHVVVYPPLPSPAQPRSHHRGVGWRHKRRWVQAEPQHSPPPIKAQGTWPHLTANIWEWLGGPGATGSSSQDPSSKRRKKKILSGWSRSLDVGNVRIYTHLSLVSFSCTRTHLADRTVYYAGDEYGRSGCTQQDLSKFCRLDERLTQFTSLLWTFAAASVHKRTARLSSLSALFGCLVTSCNIHSEIRSLELKEVTTG